MAYPVKTSSMKKIFNTTLNPAAIHLWLLIFRIIAAAFLMTHGYPKLLMLLGDQEIQFINFFGMGATASMALAMFAEFICPIFIILGWGTRLAAIPIIINMTVAVLIAHADDPFQRKEMALLYLLIFTTLMIFGGGKYAVDRLLSKKSQN